MKKIVAMFLALSMILVCFTGCTEIKKWLGFDEEEEAAVPSEETAVAVLPTEITDLEALDLTEDIPPVTNPEPYETEVVLDDDFEVVIGVGDPMAATAAVTEAVGENVPETTETKYGAWG